MTRRRRGGSVGRLAPRQKRIRLTNDSSDEENDNDTVDVDIAPPLRHGPMRPLQNTVTNLKNDYRHYELCFSLLLVVRSSMIYFFRQALRSGPL